MKDKIKPRLSHGGRVRGGGGGSDGGGPGRRAAALTSVVRRRAEVTRVASLRLHSVPDVALYGAITLVRAKASCHIPTRALKLTAFS